MPENVRRAFLVFHAVLGGVLVVTSHNTLFHALHEQGFGHLTFVSAAKFLGAILFLVPRTVRIGGVILLLILVPDFLFEASHGDWETHLLVYSAGIWLVMANGAAWRRAERPAL